MTLKIHTDLIQGSEAWLKARLGMLTASEMKHIVTPTGKAADNDKSRSHLYELLAQKISQHVEPRFVSDDMQRGKDDEEDARLVYEDAYEPVEVVGFITNDKWGFTIGYSPDFLVGKDGCGEIKCPRQKGQIEAILSGEVPAEHMVQMQTGMLVAEREWCDFITFSAGLPMFTKRVYADAKKQAEILAAATAFNAKLADLFAAYNQRLSSPDFRLVPTERKNDGDITVGGSNDR